jgi:hypothetical protein
MLIPRQPVSETPQIALLGSYLSYSPDYSFPCKDCPAIQDD